MKTLIAARQITVRLGAHIALSKVSLAIAPGEIVTIVGPNGSGKTTLLRTLIGAQTVSQGRIERAPDLRLGYVPQRLHLDPTLPLTVARFLALPVRRTGAAIEQALERADVPDLARRQMANLSGGQFQRVLLARALLDNPNLLILDEATQGLDQRGSASFYRQIEALRETTGCAVLMVSHDLHVVMSASDRVICLNGHVCCHGTPDSVASAPEYRAMFGSGTQGTLALYRHHHDHSHDDTHHDDAHSEAHHP